MIYNGHPVSSPSKDVRCEVVSLTTVHMYEKRAHIALPLEIWIIHRSRRLSPRRFRQKKYTSSGRYLRIHMFAVSGANYCQFFHMKTLLPQAYVTRFLRVKVSCTKTIECSFDSRFSSEFGIDLPWQNCRGRNIIVCKFPIILHIIYLCN